MARLLGTFLGLIALVPLQGSGICACFHIRGDAPPFLRICSDGNYYTTSEAGAFSGTLSEKETQEVIDDAFAIQEMGAASSYFCGVS